MKKGTKITLIVVGVLLGLGVLVFVGADIALSRLAHREVRKALEALPPEYGEAFCGPIHLRLFSGTASVSDINFHYRGESVSKKDSTARPGVMIHVDRVDVGRFFYSMLFNHRVLVSDLHIVRPSLELWLDEDHPETCFPNIPKDEKLDSLQDTQGNWLAQAELMRLHIHNANLRLHSVRTKLDVVVDSCSLRVNDLAYDTTFHYNDSVYRISVEHAAVMLPDGRMRMEVQDIAQQDAGPFTTGMFRIANTMPRNKLADIVKEPVTWIDMTIESVKTSPFNPVRKALRQHYKLDAVTAVVSKMEVYRDMRYKPKKPFQMPQVALLAMPVTFRLGHVDATIKDIDIQLATTETNCGFLHLGNINATVDNITNKRNATMHVKGHCPLGDGTVLAHMDMTMSKACNFGLKLHGEHLNADVLNPFIRPLVGITVDLPIDTLDTEYSGDDVKAAGSYRMLYHGLEVKVHKEDDIPYKIVTKNANTFTTLANAFVTKSNPSSVDAHPRAYSVEWKRDEWHDVGLYFFGPCIDGTVKTLLPGLFVHMQKR